MLCAGCNSSLNVTGMDISSLYSGQETNALQLNQLYNINDSITTISILLPAGLILPDPGTKRISGRGTLKYEIIGEGKRIGLVDSATFSIADTSDLHF